MMDEAAPRYALLAQDRSRKTYEALVSAARSLWWKRGFDDVGVGEICAEAGMSKGTFYFYFPKKDDLLVELGLAALDPIHEGMLERLADGSPAHDVLVEVMDDIATMTASIPRHVMKRMGEVTMAAIERFDLIRGEHPTFADIFAPVFRAAVDRGDLPGHYTAVEIGSMLSWAVVQLQHAWATGLTGEGELKELLVRRAELFWAGAANPPRAL